MKLLSIDCAGEKGGVALTDGDTLLGEKLLEWQRASAALLLPNIKDLFNECSLSIQNIDGICVSLGPGSQTGIRVGLATAQGLVAGYEMPIYGVSSPVAEAWPHSQKEPTRMSAKTKYSYRPARLAQVVREQGPHSVAKAGESLPIPHYSPGFRT